MIPYRFHPDAAEELSNAAIFYEETKANLGKSFAAEVERTISLIRDFPEAGSPLTAAVRHQAGSILIVAVAHQRRRPGYWRKRK